jgi:hypothetical protein
MIICHDSFATNKDHRGFNDRVDFELHGIDPVVLGVAGFLGY